MSDTSGLGLAIGLMLLANLLFSFVDTSTKWLIGAGFAALQLAFLRYFVHFVITLADLGRSAQMPPARLLPLVVLRGALLVSATAANFIALEHLPLAVTSALLFLSPIFVCLFAWALLGERMSPRHWLAVAVGFGGVLLIVQPFGQAINWYAVLMLYPASAMALYQVLTRRLAGEVRASVLQFATGAIGSAALLPFALPVWQGPGSALEGALMIGIGAFAWAGHEILTRAHKMAQASTLAPFGYSFVIYLSLAGWLVFAEVPSWNVVLGAMAIIGGGVMIWRGSLR